MPTVRSRNKVILLLAEGRTDLYIAGVFGICTKTLRKHYLPQLKARDEARSRVDAARLEALWEQVKAGNVAAIKHMDKAFERLDLARTAREYEDAPRPKEPALGKKATEAREATEAGVGTDWGDDLLTGVEGRKH